MVLLIAVFAVALLGALAAYSAWAWAAIERAHPALGRFVDVQGGKLHIVELGPSDATPVVLLHGASGNLRDMRLALGDMLAKQYRVILVDRPGHGWSARQGGRVDASPARQADLIRAALETVGVRRAVLVAHSWSGALATAFALNHPQSVAGLLLLAPVTHPWPGGVAWYHHVLTTPAIGPLFARTLAWPVGSLMMAPGIHAVFAPQGAPPDYAERAGARLLLRPAELIANAQDVMGLKAFVAAQAPRYGAIAAPTVVIHGDADDTVSVSVHARAIVPMLPRGRLVVLPGVGHMVHFAAREPILAALAELSAAGFSRAIR